MTKTHDLVEDLIDMRSKLQQHLKVFQADNGVADAHVQAVSDKTVAQLKKWIEEVNGVLKSYAASDTA